jgi:NAD(P)-dependent dehydrogenase (short-subunit alcohol dehydrogenase family)
MHCMRSELQNMNNKGSIINASSVAGVAGFPKNAAYTAAKHAVIGLSRTAAKEVSFNCEISMATLVINSLAGRRSRDKGKLHISWCH